MQESSSYIIYAEDISAFLGGICCAVSRMAGFFNIRVIPINYSFDKIAIHDTHQYTTIILMKKISKNTPLQFIHDGFHLPR